LQKVKEEKDTSREILAINIDSEIFNGVRFDLDAEIKRCVRAVYDNDFEAGEITLKLNIEIPNAYDTVFKKDPVTGETMQETYRYRKPHFEHKISTVLKKQYKKDGIYEARRDVQFIDGEYVAVPIKEAQMHMDDYAEIALAGEPV
jgi:hypothetical protein